MRMSLERTKTMNSHSHFAVRHFVSRYFHPRHHLSHHLSISHPRPHPHLPLPLHHLAASLIWLSEHKSTQARQNRTLEQTMRQTMTMMRMMRKMGRRGTMRKMGKQQRREESRQEGSRCDLRQLVCPPADTGVKEYDNTDPTTTRTRRENKTERHVNAAAACA